MKSRHGKRNDPTSRKKSNKELINKLLQEYAEDFPYFGMNYGLRLSSWNISDQRKTVLGASQYKPDDRSPRQKRIARQLMEESQPLLRNVAKQLLTKGIDVETKNGKIRLLVPNKIHSVDDVRSIGTIALPTILRRYRTEVDGSTFLYNNIALTAHQATIPQYTIVTTAREVAIAASYIAGSPDNISSLVQETKHRLSKYGTLPDENIARVINDIQRHEPNNRYLNETTHSDEGLEQLYLPTADDVHEKIYREEVRHLVEKHVGLLSPQYQAIVRKKFGFPPYEPMTLQAIGAADGTTRENVRQKLERALRNLKDLGEDELRKVW